MMFIMPTIILLIVMNIFPLLWSLVLSFSDYSAINSQAPDFIGTKNYIRIFSQKATWSYFVTTAYFVVLAVAAQFIIGFGLALLLNREFQGKGLITTLMLIPMMLSPVVVGLFWRFILDSSWGLFNYLLSLGPAVLHKITAALHFPSGIVSWFKDAASNARGIIWLTRPKAALFSLVIIDTWMWSPFMMLLSLAGLSAIPKYLYEAAEIDRASTWFKFRHITFPLVAPLLLIALLFRTMDAFKLFDLVYIATAGGPGSATETVSMNLYRRAFQDYNTGESCALAYILLIFIIALSNIYIKYLNKAKGNA
ncbi:ABC transporter permease subunit [Candidatus Poribacteria bacterium]|nr:ABC transporter permease subunit [Candidatus Poribacteria bacterium]